MEDKVMKISTQTSFFAKMFGEEDAIRKLAEIGYDAYDFSMFNLDNENCLINRKDYESYAGRLRQIGEDNGIVCNQSHAPFPSYLPNDEEYNSRLFPLLVRAIEATSLLGGEIVIIHPAIFPIKKADDVSACMEKNMELYNSLLPYARDCNVKIALENMYNWYQGDSTSSPAPCYSAEEFNAYLDKLDPNHFVACLDLGHSEMKGSGEGSAAEIIRALGHDKLKALHIHDNDLIHDSHTLPFTEKMDWDRIMTALKEINYDGEFTFEADCFLMQFPKELVVHASRLMLEVGKYFVKKYEL